MVCAAAAALSETVHTLATKYCARTERDSAEHGAFCIARPHIRWGAENSWIGPARLAATALDAAVSVDTWTENEPDPASVASVSMWLGTSLA
jgi:hypothetical protein